MYMYFQNLFCVKIVEIINFINLNLTCRGLSSDQVKRRDIFSRCRARFDVTFITEKELEPYWKSEWGYKAYFSSYNSNSRGVKILIRNTFEFTVKQEISDPTGIYVILDMLINNSKITVAAVYEPNKDSSQFYESLQEKIESVGNHSILIGGDFNVPTRHKIL